MKIILHVLSICFFLLFIDCQAKDSPLELPKLSLKNSDKSKSFLKDNKPVNVFSSYGFSDLYAGRNLKIKNTSSLNSVNYIRKDFPDFGIKNNPGINGFTGLTGKKKSDYSPWESKKRFGVAVGELMIVELIPWLLSRYIVQFPDSTLNWAKVSLPSWWYNIETGYVYDGDNFKTNYFAHPYHGNLYFNSGRTNGYDFWASTGFAFAGSYLWEMLAEINLPSINDLVNTTLNGISLGEVTYKLAVLITDNKARGSERMWQEIFGTIVNPVRGFNRIISGEVSRNFANPENRKPENFDLSLEAGVRGMTRDSKGTDFLSNNVQSGIFGLKIRYENKFKDGFSNPFSNFRFTMEIASDTPHFTMLQSLGQLFGWKLYDSKKTQHTFVTSLNYSYVNNPSFLFGAATIIPQLKSDFILSKKWGVTTNVGVNLIAMGGTPNDYFVDETDGRNYDFGPGLGLVTDAILKTKNWEYFKMYYIINRLWTESEPSGSKHLLQSFIAEAQFPLKDYFAIGVSGGFYSRKSTYPDNPEVTFITPIMRLFFKTRIL